MLIKSVKISNFKSYKEECTLKDLPVGLISFFGKNGAGKSNLLDAFHFLLRGNHDYKRVKENCIHLIRHDGHEEISVEIVLFLDDKGYFRLKKTQSSQGFKYFIDNLQVPAKVFGQLFRTIGFPGLPEFYVVNPYLRTVLTQMSNKKRLNFIVSSLGQCISKGLKTLVNTMSSTENAISKIDILHDASEMANTYFDTLGGDIPKWDLHKKLLKKRDYLYLLIRFQTLTNIRRQKMVEFGSFLTPESKRLCRAKIMELENSLKITRHNIDLAETVLEDKETERLNLLTQLEKVRFEIEECVNKHKNISLAQTFDDDLSLALAKHASIKSTLDQEKTKLNTFLTDFKRQESERQLIFEKLALNDNPDLIADWYNEKIKMTVKHLVDKRQTILHLQKMINEEKEVLKNHQDNLSQSEAYCKEKESFKSGKNKLCSHSLKLQIQLNESRKKELILESAIRKSEADLNDARIQLIKTVGNNIFEGILSVQKVISHLKSEDISNGYFGLIVANFECNLGLYNAIDASAKNICHHLISRMEVGNVIMKHMKLLNLPGEVTFIPLDKIKPKAKIDVQNNDAAPLLAQLEYPAQFEKAMVYCFGQILICRNLEVAVNLAKVHNCLATTMEGDVVRCGGSMSGGYIKSNRSVKFNFERYSQIAKTKECQISELAACKKKSSQILDQITQVLSRLQGIDAVKHSRPEDIMNMIENRIKTSEEKLKNFSKQKKDTEEEVTILLNNLNILQSQGSIFDTDVESERLLVLSRTIIESKKNLEQQNLQILSYEKKIDNIQSKIQQIKEAQKDSLMKRNEKEKLKIKITDFKAQETLIAQRLKQVVSDIEKSKKELESYHQTVTDCTQNIETIKQEIENSDQTINLIKANIVDLNKQIKEISDALASTRSANLDIYKDLTLKEINKELVRTSKKIKRMEKVVSSPEIEKIRMFLKLKSKYDNIFELACIASDKLAEINDWFEKHISESVEKISTLTNFYFKKFNPDMEVCLSLEMKEDELHRFNGIALDIVTSEGLSLGIDSLSKSQKTSLIVSIVFSIAEVVNFGFILLDEIDQFMDEESVTRFMRMISEISDIQIFAASHKKCFVFQSQNIFFVENKKYKSYVRKIDLPSENIDSTIALLANHGQDSACDSEDPKIDSFFYSPPSSPPC